MAAVAVEGFADLAAELRQARDNARHTHDAAGRGRDDAGQGGDGVGQARDGADQARDDAAQARDDAAQGRDGAGQVRDGVGQRRDGAGRVRGGAGQRGGEARDRAGWVGEVAAVGAAYVGFAERRPALYDAMFTHSVDLPFASPEAPAALHAGFGELREALRPLARDDDLDLLTETFWSALHGLVTLTRAGRLPPEHRDARLALLVRRFSG
ncbi:WHG domain-containing protein [Actinomadura chibensis]|uniref:WHG domain-containing protein n=2 Tax=Actinomadura chibensis TaxID=392828 RepID=A0A5D0N3G5_9ACTN|nr:WHG domain-containing protein [Actinomadura chibensis]